MTTKWTIAGAFGEGETECSLCGKDKEGIIVEEEDGTELRWCWPCARKLIRMRRVAKAKVEPETPLFNRGNGVEA
jgi:hypothetical protein